MAANDPIKKLSDEQLSALLADEPAQSDTVKIKTLIVEDDATTQLIYEKGLFNDVFDKKMTASGKEAIVIYNEWHPDIIILDIQLREMNGDLVLKEIRQTIGDQKTTIVMATSQSKINDVQPCIDLGIEGYLVKPLSLREIGLKILTYYAKKEPERARIAEALHQAKLSQSPMSLLVDGKTETKTGE
jgi:DNA-binding response OmpR family regulator